MKREKKMSAIVTSLLFHPRYTKFDLDSRIRRMKIRFSVKASVGRTYHGNFCGHVLLIRFDVVKTMREIFRSRMILYIVSYVYLRIFWYHYEYHRR